MSLYKYEITCDVCWETWEAGDEQTAVWDLQSHLENDHWGFIKELEREEDDEF